jgi:predicted NBD/HSP70 family sugar kinase
VRTERARHERWSTAADVLAQVRRRPGSTRAAVARELRLTSGSAAEILTRLRRLHLLAETPAPSVGRGRPTTLLRSHPKGPVVLVMEVRHEDLRWSVAEVDGRVPTTDFRRHDRVPESVLADLRQALDQCRRDYGHRLQAVSVAIAATVRDNRVVQAAGLRWGAVDLSDITSLPLLVGNDATLAGVAEARTGAAAGAACALHIVVEVGVGGALIVAGRPVAGGEFGHIPFGDRRLACPCGAHGCWDLEVDGRALARRLGEPPPADPRTYARLVLTGTGTSQTRRAIAAVVTALAEGVAGLVNAHSPDIVTLGGLADVMRGADPGAFDTGYRRGLMAFLRDEPPPVVSARHGNDGALYGAAAVGLDHITTQAAVAAWADAIG